MFTPTKEELEELGFKKDKDTFFYKITEEDFILYWRDEIFILTIWFWIKSIYPRSLSDLKTIIEMFKPN